MISSLRLPALLLLSLLCSCGAKTAPSTTADSSAPRLAGGRASVEQLVHAGLEALARRDTAALRSLAVTREEFERVILPTMGEKYPAARDTSVQARAFIADNHFQSSDKAFRRALNDVGGTRLEFEDVEFKETSPLSVYTLHEGTRVETHAADGSDREVIVFGSVVEQQGIFKFLGFRDRD